MKVAILGGAGAMGGIFGGALKAGGNDVSLIDVSRAAIDTINRDGLTIEEKDGSNRQIRIPATDSAAEIGLVDLVINFVKCYHTEAAIRAAAPLIGSETAILTLQNGWGNADVIGAIVGRDKVLVGLTYHSGTLLGPGRVKHPGVGITHIGELTGKQTIRVEGVAAALRASGFETQISERILDEVWKKLALNACTLPTSALLRFFAHQLVAFDGVKDEMRAILGEVVAVARGTGITLDFDERWSAITALLERAVGGKASMLQDVEARRRTEIDVINGAIVKAGRAAGVPTPHNDAMVNLVRSLEQAYLAEAAAGRT